MFGREVVQMEEEEVERKCQKREKVKMEGCVTNELMRYLCECLDQLIRC